MISISRPTFGPLKNTLLRQPARNGSAEAGSHGNLRVSMTPSFDQRAGSACSTPTIGSAMAGSSEAASAFGVSVARTCGALQIAIEVATMARSLDDRCMEPSSDREVVAVNPSCAAGRRRGVGIVLPLISRATPAAASPANQYYARGRTDVPGRSSMLHYAAVFLVIALIAAIFGFTGLAAGAASIAKILFFIFLVVAAVTFVASLMRRGT